MIKKSVHIILISILSLVLCFNTGIQQYVHSFEHHQETVDHIHKDDRCGRGDGGFAFEEQHHHCDYLTQVLPHFIKSEVSYALLFLSPKQYLTYTVTDYTAWFDNEHFSFLLRGPPAFLS
ncbi:hypothetical protein DBR32_13010 [Taibaiella sp. KBW10]|uniref:hypothetical protein n=1 Tax=Taibaiella sp. KBW10 TaxID=2153357 RepID=UPI000F5AAC8C|nr:hypothetical protein [Taibaiella sp. KBW10]RQO30479.1 hypothetical protein DBR32_13010 [Taibaiella sp. KBW10]